MSKAERLRRLQLRLRNFIRAAERRQGKRIYGQVIASLARSIVDERGGGAPRHGHRPPGVVALDDDVIVGGDQGRGRYRLLNFRYGLTATDDGDRVDIDAIGIICFDYVVMANWTGTQGHAFTKFDQVSTIRAYSTVDAAVDHGIANIGRDFSILVCPGTYNEAVSIGAFGQQVHIYGMGQDVVTIGGSNGHMTLGASPDLWLHNLTLTGVTNSFKDSAASVVLNAFNVKFAKPVDARWAGASFWNCDWASAAHMTPGTGSQSVRIYGGLMESANLDFTGASGASDDWRVYGLDMQGTASLKLKFVTGSYFNLNFTQQMNDQVYFDTNNQGLEIDCSFAPSSNSGQVVRVINGATAKSVHLKGNFKNTAGVANAASRFIKVEGVADIWHIDAVFQEDGGGNTHEDKGAKSVSGVFTRSKFTLVPTTAEVNTTGASSGNILDSGVLTGGSVGTVPPGWNLGPDSELTIDASGDITVTQVHHTIDTNGDAASDELDTINGLVANELYFFYPAHTDRTVVFKHNVDNILCVGNRDITLDDAHDFVWGFSPDGSNIYVSGGDVASDYFLADGTRAMTAAADMGNFVVNNVADPVLGHDAVNLNTLLDSMAIALHYHFLAANVMSSVFAAGEDFEDELITGTPQELTTIFQVSTAADTPTPFTVSAGALISVHFDAKVLATAGKKPTFVYVQLGYVDADGSSNFVQIGSDSDPTTVALTTDKEEVELHIHVAAESTVPAGKRLKVKWWGTTTGALPDPTIHIYYGALADHITIPVSASILGNFLRQDGTTPLTDDWDPGAFVIGNYTHTEKVFAFSAGDAAYAFLMVGGNPTQLFDTDGGNDLIVYDRAANLWEFQIAGTPVAKVNASGLAADVMAELTPDAGVTVDGLTIKDGKIAKYGPHTYYIPLGMDIAGAPITP